MKASDSRGLRFELGMDWPDTITDLARLRNWWLRWSLLIALAGNWQARIYLL